MESNFSIIFIIVCKTLYTVLSCMNYIFIPEKATFLTYIITLWFSQAFNEHKRHNMIWGIVNKPASFIVCMQIEKCSSRTWNKPVMQMRMLSLPKLEKLWFKPIPSPVFRFWNQTSALWQQRKNTGFYWYFLVNNHTKVKVRRKCKLLLLVYKETIFWRK
jgi:hypothetical protein